MHGVSNLHEIHCIASSREVYAENIEGYGWQHELIIKAAPYLHILSSDPSHFPSFVTLGISKCPKYWTPGSFIPQHWALPCWHRINPVSLSQNSIHFSLEIIFCLYWKSDTKWFLLKEPGWGLPSPRPHSPPPPLTPTPFLPSVLGFFISSTLISFFLTLRVELTSLCNLLNFTDSSVSSSDCSLDWQRNRRTVNQLIAPELCPPGWHSWPLSHSSAAKLGISINLPNRFTKPHIPSDGPVRQRISPRDKVHILGIDYHMGSMWEGGGSVPPSRSLCLSSQVQQDFLLKLAL